MRGLGQPTVELGLAFKDNPPRKGGYKQGKLVGAKTGVKV